MLFFRPNNTDESKKSVSENGSLHRMNSAACSTPEFRMSVLLAREDGSKSSPALCRRSSSKRKDSHLDDDYSQEEKVPTEPDQVSNLIILFFLTLRIYVQINFETILCIFSFKIVHNFLVMSYS